MKRVRSQAKVLRDAEIVERLKVLKMEHPFWGYRRLWAHLRYVDELVINKKRVRRLVVENKLGVSANTRLRATRTSNRPKPRPTRPNQWWGIDMTKVMTDSGWVYIVLVLDWYTKKVVGNYTGLQSKADHWMLALDMAVQRQCPNGAREHDIALMSDNGSQPTSESFMEGCRLLGIQQAFTSYNNPKGNADTERMMRTMKEELLWLQEWRGISDVAVAVAKWCESYNESYLHSALRYSSPSAFEKTFFQTHETPLLAA